MPLVTSLSTAQPRIVLTGLGHFFPETVLDNQFFEELNIGSSSAWIDERVGIHARRSVMKREDIQRLRRGEVTRPELLAAGAIMPATEMCKAPWQQALARAGAPQRRISVDQVICGTSVPDWDVPANACAIANAVGLECSAFDVNSACSSFVVDLHVARALLNTRQAQTVAVFNPERYTTRLNFTDRSSCVLFGDAATAAVLETAPDSQGLELIDTIVHSAPSGAAHVSIPVDGSFSQNGAAVQKFAVTKTVAVLGEILARHHLTASEVGFFIGHQANFRMLTSACQKSGISAQQHLYNVDQFGNQGAAGAPAVLSTNWERISSGQWVVMAVVGSGLTWGAALFRRT